MASASKTSIFDRVDARRGAPASTADERRFRWVADAMLPLALTIAAAIAVLLPVTLPGEGRVALFAFALAAILWSTTTINAAYVALGALTLAVLAGGSSQERLFDALASDVVWLMIGAFVLGGAMRATGLAGRLTGVVVGRARSVRGVFWLLTTVLVPLSFFIPSTSGRAAVVMPVFRSIADALEDDRKTVRAIALLMPTVILVATICTLIGAGSHLIAVDLLDQIANQRISFVRWVLWGAPFGIVASYASCRIIMWLFLDRDRLDRPLQLPQEERGSFSGAEKRTLAVLVLMVGLWLTEAWHGVEIATVAVAGALLLTLPGIGVTKWKDGLKSVSWNLIVFVGAALALGEVLIESGAAQWIIGGLFEASGVAGARSGVVVLLIISFISLTSHVYMTSHAARAVALVPPILYLASSLDLNPVAVLFISTVGMDYCLTFPVSSKALLMFQEAGEGLKTETFRPADLLRLSSVLLILHLALILIFYYGYWRWVGLAL